LSVCVKSLAATRAIAAIGWVVEYLHRSRLTNMQSAAIKLGPYVVVIVLQIDSYQFEFGFADYVEYS
jgi:hypothetical protein